MSKILTDIQSLLSQPHLDSAVNQEAAQLYREDRGEYERRVEKIIEHIMENWETEEEEDEDGETEKTNKSVIEGQAEALQTDR